MNGKRKYCQGINLKQEYNLICTVTTHPYLKEMQMQKHSPGNDGNEEKERE